MAHICSRTSRRVMRPISGLVTQNMGYDGSRHTAVPGMIPAIHVDNETLAELAWQP